MASQLQSLLRFLSQDAKVPLALAMSKVKELQTANLDSPESIAKTKIDDLKAIFPDEKVAKQVLAAAKRVSKKRAAGDEDATSSSPAAKKRKASRAVLFKDSADLSPAEYEASLTLPTCTEIEEDLAKVGLYTNRAPLALAFVFTLLHYTMPEQPLSSRLSLAQGYIAVTSKARALYLGIDSGTSAEEEGFGEGQPVVGVAGREVRVLRRWGYEWKETQPEGEAGAEGGGDREGKGDEGEGEQHPPLWALDLEALKKSNTLSSVPALGQMKAGGEANLPIHRPEAARSYLLKAFDTPPVPSDHHQEQGAKQKKPSAAAKVAEKERNLGRLLRVLDLLYESWAAIMTPEELDKRTWGWYVKVRPAVAEGAAGWGGKNVLKLGDVLDLRRRSAEKPAPT